MFFGKTVCKYKHVTMRHNSKSQLEKVRKRETREKRVRQHAALTLLTPIGGVIAGAAEAATFLMTGAIAVSVELPIAKEEAS
jgi:hypothetical protein